MRTFLRPGKTREAILAGAMVAVAFALLAPLLRYAIGTVSDDGVYVVLGRALAHGDGYRDMHLAGQPPHTAYPPGVPLLFALAWKLGGSLRAVHAIITLWNTIAIGAAAALLWWIARAKLVLRAAVAAPLVLGPFFLDPALQYLSMPLSEPYYVLGLAAVLALHYAGRNGDCATSAHHTRRESTIAVALGLAVIATTAVRVQGIVLLPAVLLAMLIERRRLTIIAAYVATATSPIIVALLLRGGVHAIGDAPHLHWLPAGGIGEVVTFGASAVADNTLRYVVTLSVQLSPSTAAGILLAALGVGLLLAGSRFLLRRHPAIVLVPLVSLGIVLLWPFNTVRFIAALLPFFGLLIAPGMERVLHAARRQPLLRVAWNAVLVIAATSILVQQLRIRITTPAASRERTPHILTPGHLFPVQSALLLETAAWVRHNTRPDDRVMAHRTAGVHLLTGRTMLEANPPGSTLPGFGPAPFAVPGRFLAQRLLHDDVAYLIIERPLLPITHDARVLADACPHVLVPLTGRDVFPACIRVDRDVECLRPLAEAASGSVER